LLLARPAQALAAASVVARDHKRMAWASKTGRGHLARKHGRALTGAAFSWPSLIGSTICWWRVRWRCLSSVACPSCFLWC